MSRKKGLLKASAIVSLVLMILIVSSCERGPFGRKGVEGDEDRPLSVDVHKGHNGIIMDFVKNQPPNVVYATGEDSALSLTAEIQNHGTHDVAPVIYLSGYDPNIITFKVEGGGSGDVDGGYKPGTVIEGASTLNPEGSFITIGFNSQSINFGDDQGFDKYEPTFLLTACYDYMTKANPLVCVDRNPFKPVEDKACRVKDVSVTGGQGAPVSVDRVEVEATRNRMYFRIHISNKGGSAKGEGTGRGVVFKDDNADDDVLDECPYTLEHGNLDLVRYEVSLSGDKLTGRCNPKVEKDGITNFVRLVDDKAVIYCQADTSGLVEAAFETPLFVELTYGYKHAIQKKVEIRNIREEP